MITFRYKQILRITIAIAFSYGIAASPNGYTALLFDGGAPDGRTGLRIADTGFFVSAADFTTTDVWRLTGAEFWTTEASVFPFLFNWNGSLSYFIFADGGALPLGQPLFQGNGESIVKTPDPDASCCSTHFGFKYSFDFQPPVQLDADTTYWLGLMLGVDNPTINNTQAFWASTAPFGFRSGAANISDPTFSGSWVGPRSFDLAFKLNGAVVPVPAAVWLFGSGLLGLIGVARRKKTA